MNPSDPSGESFTKTAVRQGATLVRTLIQPPTSGEPTTDPWQALEESARPSVNWQKGKQVARRGAGLAVLLGLALLGAALLLPLVLLLGFGSANGSVPASWLLGFVLLLGLAGAIWTGLRAHKLLRSPSPPPQSQASIPEESDLLGLVRQYDRAISAETRPAFHATVLATRDALRATANEATLTRESFDARQAAREDLPELIQTYRALPTGTGRDQEFLEQLRLIETRMREVQLGQQRVQQRQLQANGTYLREKYQAAEMPAGESERRR